MKWTSILIIKLGILLASVSELEGGCVLAIDVVLAAQLLVGKVLFRQLLFGLFLLLNLA